jgi:hypothetical protein
MSDELLACPITEFIMSTELGDGHVGTRPTFSLKDVRVLDIILRVGNRGNGNGSRNSSRRNGNWGNMMVWRSRNLGIHILIATKNVDNFLADGEVESGSSSSSSCCCCSLVLRIASALQDGG